MAEQTVTIGTAEYKRLQNIQQAAHMVWGFLSGMKGKSNNGRRTLTTWRQFAQYVEEVFGPALEVRDV